MLKKIETVEYTFSNGVTLTGTADKLLQYAKIVGESIDPVRLQGEVPSGYYLSATEGLIEISKMETVHLVYALNKRTINYFDSLKPKGKVFDLRQYLNSYLALVDSPEIFEMFTELSNRVK